MSHILIVPFTPLVPYVSQSHTFPTLSFFYNFLSEENLFGFIIMQNLVKKLFKQIKSC